MKLVRTLILCLTLLPLWGYGQIQLGVRGGYSISGVYFIPDLKQKPLLDHLIDGGIIAKYFDLKHVGFQGELYMIQRGYRATNEDLTTIKRINTYVEMPLFFQVRANKNGFFGHVNMGFSSSFLLSAKMGDNATGEFVLTNYKLNVLKDNRFDYGLLGGVGIGYDFKWGCFQLDVKYYHGLGDLYYYNLLGNPTRSPAWAQSITLSYLVSISKKQKKEVLIEPPTIKK
jgi:hypothetical protein